MPGKRLKASAHRSPGRRSGPRAATELFHVLVEHSSEAVALLDEEAVRLSAGTEAALRSAKESYRRLVEGVRDVIFALSPGGEVTSLSPASEEMTGSPPGEWVGREARQLLERRVERGHLAAG